MNVADAPCAFCGYPGCDVRVTSPAGVRAYHARCLDPLSFNRHVPLPAPSDGAAASDPPAAGPSLEIVPLSFAEMDHAQRLNGRSAAPPGGVPSAQGKRMHADLILGGADAAARDASYYDPSAPRTGKWSDEEIAFRDELVPHFVEGSLPLPGGLKLIDFLSAMLKSKPSRLTKKMKHAKLSTRHFHLDAGHVRSVERAKELSKLELAFVNSISDAVERSEIKFHMQREWRDHLAERLTHLRIPFDAGAWLRSVDAMDRRIAVAKGRNRMVRRRFMMGKAMEKDASTPNPGIFIDDSLGNDDAAGGMSHPEDIVDYELLAKALEPNDTEDADMRDLYSSLAADVPAATAASDPNAEKTNAIKSTARGNGGVVSGVGTSSGGGGSVSSSSGSPLNPSSGETPFRSALLPSLGSAEGPNFRFAAPFLAKVTSYVERNRVPFELVDVWVPRGPEPVLDPTGATAPEPSVLGSGSAGAAAENGSIRLCFAGSASAGAQVLPSDSPEALRQALPMAGGHNHGSGMVGDKPRMVPLSSEEIYHLSLFGSYSEKFSFSSGCGLPGRVYESGVPAWEQFIANAPPHLFERRGGAMQFGINTALGLPVRSRNVGRVVVVLYSRLNREKDDALVARMIRDFQNLNPAPRWKLMVDMGPSSTLNMTSMNGQQAHQQQGMQSSAATTEGFSQKNIQISNLISLLGENMPSDQSTPLGRQLHSIMSLRLVLLSATRSPENEQLVDSILTLFESYVRAGRPRPDITLMLARDFEFHSRQHQRDQAQGARPRQQPFLPQQSLQLYQQPVPLGQQPFRCQASLPMTMQHLSIGTAAVQQQQGQERPSCQLDHTHHGQQQQREQLQQQLQEQSHGSPVPDFQIGGQPDEDKTGSQQTMNGSQEVTTSPS